MPEARHREPPPAADEDPRTPWRAQVVVAVLLAALGFAAVTQVRTHEEDDVYAGSRDQDLVDLLTGLAGAAERSRNEIARLEQARTELRSTTSGRQTALEQAREREATLSVLAGLVPVTGPGIQVTITDPEGGVGIDILLDAVQELRTAGAEAMAFRGRSGRPVRVVAQTAFEDAGAGVSVDGRRLEPPYVLGVIGEPTALAGSITFAQGPRADVEESGGTLEVEVLDSLDIQAVRESADPEFAQPDP